MTAPTTSRTDFSKTPAPLLALAATRRSLLDLLKKHGELTAHELAQRTGVTVSGVRQHLTALNRDALVTHTERRDGPGRPKHSYELTPAADALYPRTYAELTNELLEYIADESPELLGTIFSRRRDRRVRQARARVKGMSFGKRVAELTRMLDEEGYLAECTQDEDGVYWLTEYNCAIFGVAKEHSHACASEIEFFKRVLAGANIERVHHKLADGHHCAYKIEPPATD